MIQRRALLALLALLIGPSISLAQTAGPKPPAVSFWRDGPLLFLGTAHTNSVDDPQIREIQEHITGFDADLVLVEGGNWKTYANPRDAIAPDGELAYAANLATSLGRRVENADPNIASEHAHTLGVHGPDRTTLYYVLRMVPQFTRAAAQGGPTVESAMTSWLLRSQHPGGLPATSIPLDSLDHLQELCTRELPSLGTWKHAADGSWWSPRATTSKSFLQTVQATAVAFKDRYIASKVAGELKAGRRVLVVAGGAHMSAARKLLPVALAAP